MEKYVFNRKNSFKKRRYFLNFRSDLEQDPDPLLHDTDPRIRIHIELKWTRNTGLYSKEENFLTEISNNVEKCIFCIDKINMDSVRRDGFKRWRNDFLALYFSYIKKKTHS